MLKPPDSARLRARGHLGRCLAAARERAGLSKSAAGAGIGVGRQTILAWEDGEGEPFLVDALALADLYGVSLDALCGRADLPGPMDSLTTLRSRPLAVGGPEAAPSVRFSSLLELEEFTLAATPEQARQLGAELFREVELEAVIGRGASGHITGGRVVSFLPAEAGCLDPWRAWEEWAGQLSE